MSPLPAVITPDLLTTIRTHPKLRPQTWDIISAVTLCALNRPEEIPKIYEASLNDVPTSSDEAKTHAQKLVVTRHMREALLKVSPVVGVPKVINALSHLKSRTPDNLLDGPPQSSTYPSPTSRHSEMYSSSPTSIIARGETFFKAVYGKVADRVMGQMDQCGTEDLGLIARLVYGYIISNETILRKAETSFCMIAALIPQDVNPQLKGHLKGALNGGATVEEVRAVREVVIMICESAGMRKIDETVPGGWGWREGVEGIPNL